MLLKVFLVDDEQKSRETLRNMIQQFCTGIEVIGESWMVEDAAQQINKLQPDVVFLDIEMPEQNGFELFNYFPDPPFSIIFATAYSQYAIQAFRMAAIDYLLKPFNVKELKVALQRAQQKKEESYQQEKMKILQENYQNKAKKIAVPVQNGFNFIEVDSILRCEASRNYTYFFLVNGEKLIVSKPLRRFEEILVNTNFFRVNRSHLINLKFLKSYEKSRQGIVTLVNGDTVTVSKNRQEAFFGRIQDL